MLEWDVGQIYTQEIYTQEIYTQEIYSDNYTMYKGRRQIAHNQDQAWSSILFTKQWGDLPLFQ